MNTKNHNKGLTILEMVMAIGIIAVLFAAIIPQFVNINNSWASRQENLENLQVGRIITSHLRDHIVVAKKITAVSDPDDDDGFIQYEDTSGTEYRYEISNSVLWFGPVGNLSSLAESVSSLNFECYALDDLDTEITDVDLIRFVKGQGDIDMPSGRSKTFDTSIHLQINGDASGDVVTGTAFSFGNTSGNMPELAPIDATHYLCAYTGTGNDGWAIVLTVDTVNLTVSSGTPFEFETMAGKNTSLSRIDPTHFLCAYQGQGNDGWAVVLTVTPGTWTISVNTPLEYDTTAGIYPDLMQLDQYHHLCVYKGSGGDGWAVVLTVTPGTWDITAETAFEFDTSVCDNPVVTEIANDRYLCVYNGSFQKGYASILRVDTGTWIISEENNWQFSPGTYYTPALMKVDDNHYFTPFAASNGWAVVLGVNTGTWVMSRGPALQWEDLSSVGRSAIELMPDSSNEFLCLYKDVNQYLYYTTLSVDTSTNTVSEAESGPLTDYRSHWPDIVRIDNNNYLCVYESQNNKGWAMIINVGSGGLAP